MSRKIIIDGRPASLYNQIKLYKDIYEEKKNWEELLKIGDKGEVPFLVDTEKSVFMYESIDIIKYMEKNYKG